MIVIERLRNYLELVRFSHTVFALPFALAAMLTAAEGLPSVAVIAWILVCMVTARTGAMTFNRIVDARIDALNPRTQSRHIPSGRVSMREAIALWLASSGLFIFAAWNLNPLAFALSPVALLVVCGYSYMKRFTSLCHFVLGLSLGIAPIGAWIAVTGAIETPPLILAAGVLLWVSGFDIIYALLDEEFDRKQGLNSMVTRLGKANALRASFALHILSVAFIALFGVAAGFGGYYFLGTALIAGLIVYEHTLVSPNDVSRVNVAFFNVNGVISVGLLIFVCLELFL